MEKDYYLEYYNIDIINIKNIIKKQKIILFDFKENSYKFNIIRLYKNSKIFS